MCDIVEAQGQQLWFVLMQPIAFVVFVISATAETNRVPFDLVECEAEIVADFMVPEYRDFKAGRFLYRVCRMRFKELGVRSFAAQGARPQQVKYYLKNGFRKVAGDGAERYVLEL